MVSQKTKDGRVIAGLPGTRKIKTVAYKANSPFPERAGEVKKFEYKDKSGKNHVVFVSDGSDQTNQ